MYLNFSNEKWSNLLKANNTYRDVKHLDEYIQELLSRQPPSSTVDLIQAIEVLTLLESVFRNVLCRSYVPAYRSINMNCGRYRAYVRNTEESLFHRLGFTANGDNLLTYTETDPQRTILCALVCSVYWMVIDQKLEKAKS